MYGPWGRALVALSHLTTGRTDISTFRKAIGEEWLVLTLHGGGQMEIHAKDDAMYDPEYGLVINHNDGAHTVTFVPAHAVAWIRSWWPNGEPGGIGTFYRAVAGPARETREIASGNGGADHDS